MTKDSSTPPSLGEDDSPGAISELGAVQAETETETADELDQLAIRLVRAEAQIFTLQEAVGELHHFARSAKQRALMTRLFALIIALAALFYLMYRRGAVG